VTAVAGICLAAGASTRMGSPKALLDFGGRTAVEIAVANLRRGGCGSVFVVVGAEAERIRAAVPAGVTVVANEGWRKGRTGSVRTGIDAAGDAPAFVLLPVDHPLVVPDDVAALLEAWRAGGRPPVVRTVREGRGGHPILIDAALVGAIRDLDADAPLREVIRAHRDREVTVEGSPGVLVNVDTPEDYDAALTGRESMDTLS
jgi:CTP:molybdopterin cytidylyltransferase MocA